MLDETKVLKCKVCGEDVTVNAMYPISTVTCQKCHAKTEHA